jgi:hypothetical protein
MNAEDSVTNVRDLLLNVDPESTRAFFRTFTDNGDDVSEVEMSPTEMSGFLYENDDLNSSDDLYITIDPIAGKMDIIITTYKR